MELRHIHYFLTVAEEGSFTGAAEKLMMAQPPLSRQIKDLEEELGAELFVRRPRGCVLTEAGHRFYRYAVQMDTIARKSAEDIREMNRGLSGTLYIGTVEGAAPRILSRWIGSFHKKYPLVEFHIQNGSSDDVVRDVHSGLCEVGMITAPYDAEGLNGFTVYEEPWIVMIPADHPLASLPGDTVELKELAPYELIIPSRESRKREIEEWFAPFHIRPKVICRIAHMLNAYELTAHGLGIAIYPATAGFGDLKPRGEKVCIRTIVSPRVFASYILVRSADRPLSLLPREFWDHAAEIGFDDTV